jgi:hypothetical protein
MLACRCLPQAGGEVVAAPLPAAAGCGQPDLVEPCAQDRLGDQGPLVVAATAGAVEYQHRRATPPWVYSMSP